MRNLIIAIILLFPSFDASPQNVGIGTTTPAEKLDITGHIKITGEIKPNGVAGQPGQVLTANGNGTMQWATATTNTTGNGGWGDCSIYNIDSYYPVRNIDPQNGDRMGKSVSISGDYAIVGSPDDDEGGFTDNGSATIFKRNIVSGAWESQIKLINANSGTNNHFGKSVSIAGDYAIVGSPFDTDAGGVITGSAIIFKRNSTTGVWESQGKLFNLAGAEFDEFGSSVAISGDYVIVGSPFDDEGGFMENGSATIFKRNSSTGVWENQGKLINPASASGDVFGYSVSISGDYAIVGSPDDDEGLYQLNGSATIFKRNASTGAWQSQGKLFISFPVNGDGFGVSVSISGDNAIVGAYGDDEDGFINNGSVTIFKRNAVTGIWESQAKLINPSSAFDDSFGWSVAMSGDYAIVGAYKDDENTATNNGSVTIFKRQENVWFGHQKFSYPVSFTNGFFGIAVSIDGSSSRFVVGAEGVLTNKGAAFFGSVK